MGVMKKMGSIGIIAATVLAAATPGEAKVINAASCSFADVSSAVAQASPGDVVQLPVGTNWWSQTLNLPGVSLIGAGTNLTVIIDEENRSVSPQIINVDPVAGTFQEIANIQFEGGITNTGPNYTGCLAVNGVAGASWRIDHNVFNGLYGKNICTYGNSLSVIDHNTFYEKYISVCDYGFIPGDGEGDISWSTPPTYGLSSSNCLYVEDNYFTNTTTWLGSVGATDGDGGGRIVFRHNIVMNDVFNNHGTESGGRVRSQRSFEVYNNTFTCPPTDTAMYPIYAACMIRGGSGVIFSNTVSGYKDVAVIRNLRYTCPYYGEWYPLGGANGLSPFDSNDPTLYQSGKSTGPNGSVNLQESGANWTPNQWYGYTLINTNTGNFSPILSNTVNTIYYIGSDSVSATIVTCGFLTFSNGDGFQIRRVFAALDQPGRGSGDRLSDQTVTTSLSTILSSFPYFGTFPWLVSPLLGTSGILMTINTSTGKPSWPNEALDGIYTWNNTLNGADGLITSWYPGLQIGRDVLNDTPKPNYTPWVYPHPLTYITVSTNYSGGNTNQPPNTNNFPTNNFLQPPTNLHQIYP
jgi:hypothetical protein